MNRALINISTTLLLYLLVSLPLLAEQKTFEVESFDGVDIGTGMEGVVSCGNENTVTLHGEEKAIDNVKVNVENGMLDISRRKSIGKIFNSIFGEERNNSIRVEVTIDGQLSNIEASTGSSLTIPECAVNSSFVEIDTSTGATINIEGSTATLELDLSTGSLFNQSARRFTVDVAEVDLSTGAVANLCGAGTIKGSASTGAVISASETANTENVSLSTGANVSKNNCR